MLRAVALTIVLGIFTFAASAAEIETAKGPVTVDAIPQRVAVFDMAALDTIDALGIKPAGVPENVYLPELERLKADAEIVGNIFEPNLEALSALAPDLIIVGGRSSPQLESLSRVTKTIDMTMDGDDLYAQAQQRLKAYGALFGKEADATRIAAQLDGTLAAARAAVAGKGKALIIMTSGPKVSAYGLGSRFGWIHTSLELAPAIENMDAATHGEAVSFEFIRDANPDWLLVLDRAAAIGSDEQNAKATLDNELVQATTAWKKGQVVYLPSADFYIAAGGVQAMQRVFATITDAFAKSQ